jgi:NAD+ synthase
MLDITKNLIIGIKEYFENTNGKKAVIGISGGKDSTVAAALLVKALGKENVFGVLMPNGLTSETAYQDLSDGQMVCRLLGIKYYVFDIHGAYFDILTKVENLLYCQSDKVDEANASQQTKINLAPRLRMTTLYAIAQSLEGGRVINTTNACESFVGYGTLFGDTVGDFAIFKNTTVSQVCKIGDDLGLPYDLVHKIPSDGLTGKSDEEVLGVSYDDIENYMNYDGITVVDIETAKKFNIIKQLHEKSQFKRDIINLPSVII